MSATGTTWSAVTATPSRVSEPAPGSVLTLTAASALAGESLTSENPKSSAPNTCEESSSTETVPSAPAGASLTLTTFTVIVFAVGSRFLPPLAIPPSSLTWKSKEAYPAPLASGAGVKTSLPASMSATGTTWSAVTATPSRVSEPAPGSVLTLTAASALAGESLTSENPKSSAPNTCEESSSTETVPSAPAGASLTLTTFTVIVFAVGSRFLPPLAIPPSSLTWKSKEAYP